MFKPYLLAAFPLVLALSSDALAKPRFWAETHVPRKVALASTNAPEPVVAEPEVTDPDATKPAIAPPHFAFSIDFGASLTSVDVGVAHLISYHGHVGTFIGHEVFAGSLFKDRLAISVGYMGAYDANDTELLHRHGIGVMFAKSWLSVAIGGGVGLLHGFQDGGMWVLPGLQTDIAFRFGGFKLGFPIDLDVVGDAPATTFAITLGYAH
jgi:hypothetical protein